MTKQVKLKEQLKQRLFKSISTHIDLITSIPEGLDKLLKNFQFESEIFGNNEINLNEKVDKKFLIKHINQHYDHIFYDHNFAHILWDNSNFRNLGYWKNDTIQTQHDACEKLMDKLLDFIPDKSGRILDVACGMGASTQRLLNHYNFLAKNIWAINISEKQISTTLQNAPGCNAIVMNATNMIFNNDFFNNILCIEAAFHFETRRKFLEEAHRILKPGGQLVLSDIFINSTERLKQYNVLPSPENYLESIEEYYSLLSDIGFKKIIIEDVTQQVWYAHFFHAIKLIHQAYIKNKCSIVQLTDMLWTYYQIHAITGTCLFISTTK